MLKQQKGLGLKHENMWLKSEDFGGIQALKFYSLFNVLWSILYSKYRKYANKCKLKINIYLLFYFKQRAIY